jgi:hypothetical protein
MRKEQEELAGMRLKPFPLGGVGEGFKAVLQIKDFTHRLEGGA